MGRAEVQLHSLLTLAVDGGQQLTSHPCCFTPGKERTSSVHLIWWMSTTVSLDEKNNNNKKKTFPYRDLKPGPISL
jgi:hypothetical protein